MQEALQLLATGDLSQARLRLEQLADMLPESAQAMEILSIVALAKGDKEMALRQAGRACELAPQAAMPWVIKKNDNRAVYRSRLLLETLT